MRQRAAPFVAAPAAQEFPQKAGWYPAETSFQPQPQTYFASGQAAPMMISSYPAQQMTFQTYPQSYTQQVPYAPYPGYRPETFYPEENPAQIVTFRQPVAPPPPQQVQTVPQVPQVTATRIYQPVAPQAPRIPQQQVIVQQIPPTAIKAQPVQPPITAAAPTIVPQPPMIAEKVPAPPQQYASSDISAQPLFDHLKYPQAGCFSIVKRGNLPGINIVPF